MIEIEEQTFIYTRSLWMYNRDPAVTICSARLCRQGLFIFGKKSDLKQLAEDVELQRQRRDPVSAPREGESDDEYFTIAERKSALPG